MGTRSVTHFMDSHTDEVLVNLYRQYDGYPTGHGRELADFLYGFRIVNGYTYEDSKSDKVANGMGCLSAQAICYFKDGQLGGFYIVDNLDHGQDYDYYVKVEQDGEIKVRIVNYSGIILDWASTTDFLEYCSKEQEEE